RQVPRRRTTPLRSVVDLALGRVQRIAGTRQIGDVTEEVGHPGAGAVGVVVQRVPRARMDVGVDELFYRVLLRGRAAGLQLLLPAPLHRCRRGAGSSRRSVGGAATSRQHQGAGGQKTQNGARSVELQWNSLQAPLRTPLNIKTREYGRTISDG